MKKELVQNDNLRTAASALGERIRAENGIANAVSLIEETFSQHACMPRAK